MTTLQETQTLTESTIPARPTPQQETGLAMSLAERGRLPDWLIRHGIRRLLRRRLHQERARAVADTNDILTYCQSGPIAEHTDAANAQHYEVPAAFYETVLGPHLKYSCCDWADDTLDLGDAEQRALGRVCQRAELSDGQRVLELGCGWGSLSLWMAQHYPNSHITAVSNSHAQRRFIEARAEQRGLTNLRVITRNINVFDTDQTFDRVVSVEMFEHMRNLRQLLHNITNWLSDDGKLFVHVFSHRDLAYRFETEGDDNWLGRHFFTGGIMPSDDLLPRIDSPLRCEHRWIVSGTHYQRTAEAWLDRTDAERDRLLTLFSDTYGPQHAALWLQRWRIFFMACAELWGYQQGSQWHVAHYLFSKKKRSQHDVPPVDTPVWLGRVDHGRRRSIRIRSRRRLGRVTSTHRHALGPRVVDRCVRGFRARVWVDHLSRAISCAIIAVGVSGDIGRQRGVMPVRVDRVAAKRRADVSLLARAAHHGSRVRLSCTHASRSEIRPMSTTAIARLWFPFRW